MTLFLTITCVGLVGVTAYLWEHVCVLEEKVKAMDKHLSHQSTLISEYSTRLNILEVKQTQEITND